ncbi:MAG: PIN domain-containing protein [Nitrospirae bacterium]|nr:PIN domain-containing protein [Nitrospirota bacterium]
MILVDTNILVYAHNSDSELNEVARRLMLDAVDGRFDACITPQNLLEFFSVITNPKRVERPLDSKIAQQIMLNYWHSQKIHKIYPSNSIFIRLAQLVKEMKITKTEIFDCHLYVTMEENNVFEIYTKDIHHFTRFPDLKVIDPFL